MKRKVDISSRYKDYTAELTLNGLPANHEQIKAVLGFLGYVKERGDVSVVMRINDEQYANEVPQTILFAESPKGLYMELCYSMDDFGWNHSLLLAHDHLSEEDAAGVLVAILDECTDNVLVIQKEFRDITGWVYEDKETGDKSQT